METGARAALPIWKAFMRAALEGQPQHYFNMPEGVARIYINPKTGARRMATQPDAVPVLVRSKSSP
jgi:penicillin-binding protein 1A